MFWLPSECHIFVLICQMIFKYMCVCLHVCVHAYLKTRTRLFKAWLSLPWVSVIFFFQIFIINKKIKAMFNYEWTPYAVLNQFNISCYLFSAFI